MGPHLKRWITGIAILPVVLLLIGYGSLPVFSLLILLIALLASREYYRMVLADGDKWQKVLGCTMSSLVVAAMFLGDYRLVIATLSLSVIGAAIVFLWQARKETYDFLSLAHVIFSLFYITLGISHLILIRQTQDGVIWVFFVLVLAFTGDTAAYYVGRRFGKRKLMPAISPGKTVEGTIGLIAGSTIGCLLFAMIFLPELHLSATVFLAILGSIVGQLGDLSESAIKRFSLVKDSGSILPGHGGILDRIDDLIFIAPLVYYYRHYVLL